MIQFTRKMTGRWYVIMPLCVILLSFTQACTSNGGLVRPEAPTVDNEALARGIFFAEGEVASRITAYNGLRELREEALNDEQKAALIKVQDELMSIIKANDPSFLNSFGTTLRSGDHLQIQKAVKDGSQLVVAAARQYVTQRNIEVDGLTAELDGVSSNGIATTDLSKESLRELIAQKKAEISSAKMASVAAQEDIIDIDVWVEVDVVAVAWVLFFVAVADIVVAIANPDVDGSDLQGEILIQNIVTDLNLNAQED